MEVVYLFGLATLKHAKCQPELLACQLTLNFIWIKDGTIGRISGIPPKIQPMFEHFQASSTAQYMDIGHIESSRE